MDTKNILVIGDLHTPFEHKGYLEHCKEVAKKFKTTHTIFIGDVIDSHAASFHDSDPDGYSAGHELEQAIKTLAKWHKAFPGADVIIGNHEAIIARKLFAAGVSSKWQRKFEEVLGVPTWRFSLKKVYNNVLYVHGLGTTARTKALRAGRSVVQGHRHTEGYVWIQPTDKSLLFGMQVGTGIDENSYAFAYAKDHPSPVLACAVVLNNGKLPILLPM